MDIQILSVEYIEFDDSLEYVIGLRTPEGRLGTIAVSNACNITVVKDKHDKVSIVVS